MACALGLTALLITVGPARAAHDEGPGPLPWRVSGTLAFTVDAAAFPDSAGQMLEVYVRVPPATIADLVRDTLGEARIKLTVRLRSAYGALKHEAVQSFTLAAADTTGGFGKVVMIPFRTGPGKVRLQARLEDEKSRRRGLAYVGRKVTESAAVDGEFQVPAPQAGRQLSDLEFVWQEGIANRPNPFQHGARTILPNPERLYGLYQNMAVVHFVATSAPGDDRPWHWVARLLDHESRAVAIRESTATAAPRLVATASFDVSGEPAGLYSIEVKAWQEGDPGALSRESRFSVAWTREAWFRDPRELEDIVHFLLDPDAEEAFVRLSPGEQERYLEDFWRERDPTPDTAENEAKRQFFDRVEHANETWGRAGLGPGMFSDMGRVYIRYGPPSETYHQVIPTGNETLDQVAHELALTETRPVGDVTDKSLGGDQRPFEVWIYDAGSGLPPDADPKVAAEERRQRRKVFLFVDEHGLGDFRLRYSTE